MRLLFELLGEHETLPRSEVLAAIQAEGSDSRVLKEEGRIFVVETDADPELVGRRLGLTHYVDEYLASGTLEEIEDAARDIPSLNGTIALRRKDLRPKPERKGGDEVFKRIGNVLTRGREVNLRSPDSEIRLIFGGDVYLALRKFTVDRSSFDRRKVQNRPFFSPISLHPKYARAMVNLARTERGRSFLDPFCGTGGILIEAGLIGARTIGSDIKEDMIEGCRENLRNYNLDPELFQLDVGDVGDRIDSVSSIATDPPYGRSSSTMKEDIKSLYERSFRALSDVLDRKGHLAIVLPSEKHIDIGKRYLDLREVHEQRVHRSLNRHYCVFKNH